VGKTIFPQKTERNFTEIAISRDVNLADDEAELARVVKNLINMLPESCRSKDDGGRSPRQSSKSKRD
tara:strand:+ start:46 stop:246 length:201 start_codon:yes stop_codon:yes gene_type:complete